jgi:transposase
LPERAPGALVADKAYDSDAIRDDLKQRGIRAVIPPKSNRTKTICYNKRLYRQRNCIEQVICPRGLATSRRKIRRRRSSLRIPR